MIDLNDTKNGIRDGSLTSRWDGLSDELKPWQADIDAECPSSLAMDCVKDPSMKQEIISAIASMTDRKRVIFEVHMASELRRMIPMRTHVQKKINTWLEHCSDRLADCMATAEVN